MGATEILEALKEGDKLTSSEISERIDCSLKSIKQAIKRLVKDVSEDVQCRPLTPDEKIEKYGRNLGCKIYIYWIGIDDE